MLASVVVVQALWGDPQIEIEGVDIYRAETVSVVTPYLPYPNETFDGVWIQAVLEHVGEPWVVVAEIHRVLKKSGLIYAETPFMQQVHEGAYDFTRFTVLGHRYLFDFEIIDAGEIGAETVCLVISLFYLGSDTKPIDSQTCRYWRNYYLDHLPCCCRQGPI